MRVSIRRATPFSVQVDGQTLTARTLASTVAEALTELGVTVRPLDRVEPPLDAPLSSNTPVFSMKRLSSVSLFPSSGCLCPTPHWN